MSKLKPAVSNADHIQGDRNARLELVEYGDYQCPHCGMAYPIIKKIQTQMGKDLKFVFRNFPLSEAHPDAVNGAIATEAAALQNKFWEMHDILFEHQNHLDDKSLVKYAARLGLDLAKFEQDFEQPALMEKVDGDFESGVRSGVNGTPTFFVNGEKYNGSWEETDFIGYLEGLLR